MAKPENGSDLDQALTRLPGLLREELLGQYESLYKRPAPKHMSSALLRLAVAYRMQERVYGGMSIAVRRFLLDGDALPMKPSVGTVLLREWQGVCHTVTVHADRVEYAGRSYSSLSEVARLITGVRRSGPAFFGLKGSPNGP